MKKKFEMELLNSEELQQVSGGNTTTPDPLCMSTRETSTCVRHFVSGPVLCLVYFNLCGPTDSSCNLDSPVCGSLDTQPCIKSFYPTIT